MRNYAIIQLTENESLIWMRGARYRILERGQMESIPVEVIDVYKDFETQTFYAVVENDNWSSVPEGSKIPWIERDD